MEVVARDDSRHLADLPDDHRFGDRQGPREVGVWMVGSGPWVTVQWATRLLLPPRVSARAAFSVASVRAPDRRRLRVGLERHGARGGRVLLPGVPVLHDMVRRNCALVSSGFMAVIMLVTVIVYRVGNGHWPWH